MDLAEIVFGGGGTYGLSVGFPIMLIFFFFFLHRGCWVLSHRECRTYSIFDQENKVLFIPLFSGQAFRAKKLCLSFCLCAGAQVSQKGGAFLFDKCTCFLSGICQCAKLPVHAQLDLTHIGRCFSFYLIESVGIMEFVRLNLTITLPSGCA